MMIIKQGHSNFVKSILIGSCYLLIAASLLDCKKDDCCPAIDPSTPMLDLAVERHELAIDVSSHFIVPAYVNLAEALQLLSESVQAIKNELHAGNLEIVKLRLKEVWLIWQDAAIYQMGPTENNALRAAINLYPIDASKIENNISSGNFTIGSIGNKGAEGLPALDYLLNGGSTDEVLMQLEDEQRIAYIEALTQSLQNLGDKVAMDWANGPFTESFVAEDARGTDVGSAIGQLTNAMDLHFQRFLRDGKVAIPAGVRSAGVARPKAVEAFYGGYSKELFIRSLQAYVDLMEGNGLSDVKGTSFFSYLESINQASLVTDLRSKFDDAFLKANMLDPSFALQIETNNEALIELFLSLQEILTLIKSDMASVIGITITNQDNDGD